MKKARISEIDAARGSAMFFVFISHFGYVYFGLNDRQLLWSLFAGIGMVASPTFMIISGCMLGYLYRLQYRDFRRIKIKLIDRGLFLITIGHVLIMMAHVSLAGGIRNAIPWVYITDAIGISIILGPLLIARVSRRIRIHLSLMLFAVNWLLVLFWSPGNTFLHLIKETFVGDFEANLKIYRYLFPILPWFALYFASSSLGEKIGEMDLRGDRLKIRRLFLQIGIMGITASLLLSMPLILKRLSVMNSADVDTILHVFSNPFQKLPPSLPYYLLYGGIGMIITYLLFHLNMWKFTKRIVDVASIIGRTSLFVFIIQYCVYYTLLYSLKLKYSNYWPVIFAFSMIPMILLAKFWDRNGYNRFITVGLVPHKDT